MPVQRTAPDPDAVKQAAQMLLAAKNPLLLGRAGRALRRGRATGSRRWPSCIPAPVATTNPGKSAIPESHPLSLGASTRSRPKMFTDFMAKADLVLAIGSSLTKHAVRAGRAARQDHHPFHQRRRRHQQGVPRRSRGGRRRRAGARRADRGGRPAEGRRGGGNALASLKEEVAAAKKAWLAEWAKHLDSDETPLNQYRVIRDLMRTVDRDNVIMTHDSGSPREQMMPFWETTAPGSYMGWGKSTQLGYGLGIIMGAKLAAPDKLCVNVMGDAAIGMTGMDIETAARNRIAILTVVFNNGVMGAERDVLKISDREVRRDDGRRQLHQGRRGAQRRGAPGREAGRHRRRRSRRRSASPESGAPFLLEFVVKEGHDFSRYPLAGL